MTEDNRKPADASDEVAGTPSEETVGSPENGEDGFAAERERYEAEITALKDKFLRAFAEADNVRRRAEREVADAKVYGITGFARDVLSLSDDFERALGAIQPDARASAEGTLKTLLDGIELTARSLTQTLAKHGVVRIDAEGSRFDPNLHQAIFEVPNAEVPSGTVVQVIQPGYTIGGRVLRPAMVGVSKGGPKAAPAESQTSQN
ncbi:molecular chaperone GrpE [Ancylobacter sp. 3268]|uniref:nucleotide exchange factor GrpE n=1 Tax=Ancylobacter sp. 3268 TaxID=2817752 RepID=UPI0028649C5D|nr:nucleotide exchange factor GrpE [Ancylobacter sp. 3268]MDR6952607.1 molecular chaperone GrpE [Ancylobacter sp. 3268]